MKKVVIFLVVFFMGILSIGKTGGNPNLSGDISGKVISERGNPLPGSKVILRRFNEKIEIQADNFGQFIVRNLPLGKYQFFAVSPGGASSIPKEAIVHLDKINHVILAVRESPQKKVAGLGQVSGPYFYRNSQGQIIRQTIIIDDKFYDVEYGYDEKGKMLTSSDNLQENRKYEYTPNAKIWKVTRGDGKKIWFNYDKQDSLWKVDLPLGYKIIYSNHDNIYKKTIKKYNNLILHEFEYTFDKQGNKSRVQEGAERKEQFSYKYDDHNRLLGIKNLTSGKEKKLIPRIKENPRYKNSPFIRFYDYEFDSNENLIHLKDKHAPKEVYREFNERSLLVRESYFYDSSLILSVEYAYDDLDNLVMKTFSHGIRYYYLRNKDGQVVHKIIRNMLTGKETDAISFSPDLAEFDQNGFELIKFGNKNKLFIFDAEGNKRYLVEIGDVFKFSTKRLSRDLDTDGEVWGGLESILSHIRRNEGYANHPSSSYLDDFNDFPLINNILPEQLHLNNLIKNSEDWDVGCYDDPPVNIAFAKNFGGGYCSPEYVSCVDCGEGGGPPPGGDPGGGGTYDCDASIIGDESLEVYEYGYYSLSTTCNDPQNIYWWNSDDMLVGDGWGTSYMWTEPGNKSLYVTFTTSSGGVTISKEEVIIVTVEEDPEPTYIDVYPVNEIIQPTVPVWSGERVNFPWTLIYVYVYDQSYNLYTRDITVSVSCQGAEGTGGHAHSGRPSGLVEPNLGIAQGGIFTTFYTPPEVGGMDYIYADAGGATGGAQIYIAIQGLVHLPHPNPNYETRQVDPNHPEYHYGTPSTVQSLQTIALLYHERFPNEQLLLYNDMSLEYGGLFDVFGTWTGPHWEHRYGTCQDLQSGMLDSDEKKAFFREIFSHNGGSSIVEEAGCWHLRFGN